jgi:hypothetical protein
MVSIGIALHLNKGEVRDTVADFITSAVLRTIQKINHPIFGLYAIEGGGGGEGEQYQVIYHDPNNGYQTERVTSFNEGTARQQEYLDDKGWSSCILLIKGQTKTVHHIIHPIKRGYIVPDFQTYVHTPKDFNAYLKRMNLPNS